MNIRGISSEVRLHAMALRVKREAWAKKGTGTQLSHHLQTMKIACQRMRHEEVRVHIEQPGVTSFSLRIIITHPFGREERRSINSLAS